MSRVDRAQVLEAREAWTKRHGQQPTAAALAEALGLHESTVMRILRIADQHDHQAPMSQAKAERRRRLVACIAEHVQTNGWPPSQREMCEALDTSLSTVSEDLEALVRDGLIEMMPGQSRAVRIVGAKMVMPEVTL